MRTEGVVGAVGPDGFVDLEIDAPRCAGCAGVCLWRRLPARFHTRLRGPATVPVGARVSIALPQRYVLLAALLLHGLPWGAMLAGAALGAYLTHDDWGAVVGALLAIAFSFIMTPGLRRRLERAAMERFTLRPLA